MDTAERMENEGGKLDNFEGRLDRRLGRILLGLVAVGGILLGVEAGEPHGNVAVMAIDAPADLVAAAGAAHFLRNSGVKSERGRRMQNQSKD